MLIALTGTNKKADCVKMEIPFNAFDVAREVPSEVAKVSEDERTLRVKAASNDIFDVFMR